MYKLTRKEIISEGERYIVYGISCEATSIDDVSSDKEKVERLISQFNRFSLSPVHLRDAVEDYLLNQ